MLVTFKVLALAISATQSIIIIDSCPERAGRLSLKKSEAFDENDL